MNSYDNIPIENIYYMLCYSWDRLEAKNIVNVSQCGSKNIYDLLSRILVTLLNKLIKKGFYREYKLTYEETQTLKGKINFDDSLKRNSFRNGRAYCCFDEFDRNITHNQIIKATVYNLLRYSDLSKENRENLRIIYKYFEGIKDIKLDNRIFFKAKIHKNNKEYDFILQICRLVYDNLLINEKNGEKKFSDFVRDEKAMALLFENFIRNFYKKELHNVKVYRQDIKWDIEGEKDRYLPKMQTDINIDFGNTLAIMDTKYYKNPFRENYGVKKLKSENLYQIYSYIMNIDKSNYDEIKGALLYPLANDELNLKYNISGYDIHILSVDLSKEWMEIHERLIEIAEKLRE